MTERVDWLESIAIASLKSMHENTDLISKEGHATLTIILSGLAIALGYSAKLSQEDTELFYTALVVVVYLVIVAVMFVINCFMLKAFPALYNEPKNLDRPDLEFEKLRMMEIKNIQIRIDMAAEIIRKRSEWLNRTRVAVAITPVIAIIGFLIIAN